VTPEHHVIFDHPDIQTKLEEMRKAVSWEHGRPMVVKSVRHNHYINDKDQGVWELWATFEDAPPPPEKSPTTL
jgi:hypothetical protein